MAKRVAYVDPKMCDGAPTCPSKRVCPTKAISQSGAKGLMGLLFGGGISKVDEAKCTGCGLCVKYCPHAAIKMVTKK